MSKTYTKGFKRDAVNHLIVNGKTIREAADSLGIWDLNLAILFVLFDKYLDR